MLLRLAIFKLLTFILFLMHNCECTDQIQPLGSILFEDHGFPKKCFIQNDIAQLATRLKFQNLLPKNVEQMSDASVVALIKYFYGINEIIEHINQGEARQLVLKCFYDMLGGYLKHIIIPLTKYSFYAGNTTFSVAQNVFDLYEHCRELLDTNGNSWADPITDFSKFHFKVIPLVIPKTSDDEAMKACANLMTNQNDYDNEEDMLVSLPKIETEENDDLSSIRFPMKRMHTYSINSKKSAFIFVRYFVMVSQCFKYQGINQSLFNKRFIKWLNDNVIPYLDDDQLYPAFGAVLRIMESVKGPLDATYQGSKDNKIKRQKEKIFSPSNFLEQLNANSKIHEFSFDDKNRDSNWWMNIIASSVGICFLVCLFIFLVVRICCNKKRIQEIEYGKKKSKTFKEKISNILRSSTHIPEHDEFYEYKKSRDKKGIKFENERLKKPLYPVKKSKTGTEFHEYKLPLLNPDSEDDIVLHESKKSTPKSSLLSLNKKNIFKLSEDSDNESNRNSRKLQRFLKKNGHMNQ